MDLALNNLQRLICHKTHRTKPVFWRMSSMHEFRDSATASVASYVCCFLFGTLESDIWQCFVLFFFCFIAYQPSWVI